MNIGVKIGMQNCLYTYKATNRELDVDIKVPIIGIVCKCNRSLDYIQLMECLFCAQWWL